MKILGIETSCDETSAAVVNSDKEVLSNVIFSQIMLHKEYGGVVPEIASRSHIKKIKDVIFTALEKANSSIDDIDAVAVTSGPGLIGGLIVGLMVAKGIAVANNKAFLAINHLEGHALTTRFTNNIDYPFLLLLVSGGHCQILIVHELGKYELLGQTIDDAVGEAFDKVAKILGLPYPGGPAIEALARNGNEESFSLPKPLLKDKSQKMNFSFSGLKTAVLHLSQKTDLNKMENKANIAASFQKTVSDILVNRMSNSVSVFREKYPSGNKIVISGGVAANQYIKKSMKILVDKHNMEVVTPPISLCTDNAAMIAWAAIEKMQKNQIDEISVAPKSRWPIYS